MVRQEVLAPVVQHHKPKSKKTLNTDKSDTRFYKEPKAKKGYITAGDNE